MRNVYDELRDWSGDCPSDWMCPPAGEVDTCDDDVRAALHPCIDCRLDTASRVDGRCALCGGLWDRDQRGVA